MIKKVLKGVWMFCSYGWGWGDGDRGQVPVPILKISELCKIT